MPRIRRTTDLPIRGLLVLLTLSAPRGAVAQERPRPSILGTPVQMDSLERLAVSDTSARMRMSAMITIAFMGRAWSVEESCAQGGMADSTIPVHGVAARLGRIFRRSGDAELRGHLVELLAIQVECAEAAEVLALAAVEPPPPEDPRASVGDDHPEGTMQHRAVTALWGLGTPGEMVLRRLYAAGTVRERTAKETLDSLVREGFRRVPT